MPAARLSQLCALDSSCCWFVVPQTCHKHSPGSASPALHRPLTVCPSCSWFQYKQRVSQLNAFLIDLMRRRWSARQSGKAPDRGDILDRILAALEVCMMLATAAAL